MSVDHERNGEGARCASSERRAVSASRSGQEGQIIAVEPGQKVLLLQTARTEAPREREDQAICDFLAVRVMDLLEAVDIEVEHGRRRRLVRARGRPSLGPQHGVLESVDEERPVMETGEAVVERNVAQPACGTR